MKEVRDRTFAGGEMVDTDGTTFIKCIFESAALRYAGGEHPFFQECTFGDIGWYFTDAALRTIQLLQQINNVGRGSEFIADLFKPGNYIAEQMGE